MSRRLALLTPTYWPEVQRGTERIVHDLAADLVARGHQPRVVTSHPGPRECAREDGFEVVRNRRPPDTLLRLRRFHDHLTHVPWTYRTLVRGDDELAHAFYPPDALAAVHWSGRTGRPAVFSAMGLPSRATATYMRGRMRILARVTAQAHAVVGLSRAACDGLWRWWGVDARLIYPGADLSAFTRVEDAREEDPVIACAASPDDERKRVGLLVQAFERVRREHPRARLVLMRPNDHGVEQRLAGDGIEFFEPAPGVVAEVFARSWVTALTSREEAFGLVVVESLATGKPVVAAAEGGPAEILAADGVGVLFGSPDPQAVATSLLEAIELAGDPATAGRCRARAGEFTTERCAVEHERLYEELLAV